MNGQAESAAHFEAAYRELRAAAARIMKSERKGHTLQPTALVHEAYLRLARRPSLEYNDRAHFVAIASNEMRRVLVDHARHLQASPGAAPLVSIEGAARNIVVVFEVSKFAKSLINSEFPNARSNQICVARELGSPRAWVWPENEGSNCEFRCP